ncbi:hypothetical protein CFP66_28760 [Pseudonocardia sp. MH-G8]|nr:hypothetical protein [Pseudonocardia sp. MH-G8]OZM78946.1 hypothetical protein CFP66_28760 [Pseudonocardia sp. MH-G8]
MLVAGPGGVPDVVGGQAAGGLGVACPDRGEDLVVVVLQDGGMLGGPNRHRRREALPERLGMNHPRLS